MLIPISELTLPRPGGNGWTLPDPTAYINPKSPNGKRGCNSPYLRMSEVDRKTAGEAFFQSTEFSNNWLGIQWFIGTRQQWMTTIGWLFPDPNTTVNLSCQNYLQCLYFRRWQHLCRTNDGRTIEVVKHAIEERMLGLSWLPFAQADKMWTTAQKKKNNVQRFPPGSTGPAPWIIFRPGCEPQ
jgi:hypothetical protein